MNLEKLQYFVGKVCTVHVDSVSQNLNPKQMFTYFTGYVKSIESDGIIIERVTGPFHTFIKMDNVVAIAEEETEQLNPANPEDAEVIKAVQARQKELSEAMPSGGEYVSPENLQHASKLMKNLAKQSKPK